MTLSMDCMWVWALALYAVGFLLLPFVWSLVDSFPFTRARHDDPSDFGMMLGIAAVWPLVAAFWTLSLWFAGASELGAWLGRSLSKKGGKR